MGRLAYYYHDIWNEHGDPSVTGFALMNGGPWTTVLLVAAYVYIVRHAGPRLMQTRKPFDLKQIIFVHNVCLIFLNLYMFVNGMRLTNYGLESLACKRPERTDPIKLYFGWLYFFSKFLDFFDTFFFVLRKKDRHLSFLHVYHHAMMPIFSWMFFKFVPWGNTAFVPLINAFIHIVMYTYYALSTFPSLRPFLWWKKYLTIMQLVQFVLIILHSIYSMLTPQCEWPKICVYLTIMNAMLFFYLFFSFFRTNYSKASRPNQEKLDKRTD